jgi:hypothetical protein
MLGYDKLGMDPNIPYVSLFCQVLKLVTRIVYLLIFLNVL